MKPVPIKSIRSHLPIQILGNVTTGFDAKRLECLAFEYSPGLFHIFYTEKIGQKRKILKGSSASNGYEWEYDLEYSGPSYEECAKKWGLIDESIPSPVRAKSA